jgi:hypothetical protein
MVLANDAESSVQPMQIAKLMIPERLSAAEPQLDAVFM